MATLEQVPAVLYFFVPAYLANMSPVLVRRWFTSLAVPIDARRTLRGRRILGDHKTWRGLLVGIAVAPLVLELQVLAYRAGHAREIALIDYGNCSLWLGVLTGAGTGVGDAVKSFFVGTYAFASVLYVPPLLATLACLLVVFLGSIAVTALAAWLGMKESWL